MAITTIRKPRSHRTGPKPISAEVLQKCFRDNFSRFEAPDIDMCTFWAAQINDWAVMMLPGKGAGSSSEKHARLFLRSLPTAKDEVAGAAAIAVRVWLAQQGGKLDWQGVACNISATAMHVGMLAGHEPASKNPNDPLCLFVQAVLDKIGIIRGLHAVSDALRHRRGRNAKGRAKNVQKCP